jgi:hypothetical protein
MDAKLIGRFGKSLEFRGGGLFMHSTTGNEYENNCNMVSTTIIINEKVKC